MASKSAKKRSKPEKPEKPAKPAKAPTKGPTTKPPPAKDKTTRASAPKPAKPEKPTKIAKVAFPKKNQAPSETEFAARLPMAAGKRFEMVRGFLKKQKGVDEELFFYGPKTGWAYRYVRDGQQSVCSMMIHQDRLLGIVALDPAAMAGVDWAALSPVAQKAKRLAHGSPALQWIDVPLEGTGAADFRALLKAKLKTLPILPPPTPPARASGI